VSISKRLFNFARSELNSLLDRAAELDDRDSGEGPDIDIDADAPTAAPAATAAPPRARRKVRLEDLSDEELEAEIERRRLDKELDERAARAGQTSTRPHRERTRPTPPPTSPADPVARAYAALEIPAGSDFETVRKAYRSLMRKYHPDRHTATPEKQKAANELTQKLTDAYKTLERRLRPPTVP
jgi:DnaJ-domain-containing protein 1